MSDGPSGLRPLPHGYTNRTAGDGTVVVKRYEGPDAEQRGRREHRALTGLRGLLPVPPVLGTEPGAITLGHLPGVPAQELLDTGHGPEVLAACGRVLRRLQALDPELAGDGPAPAGSVPVHGDFGPHNLLLDPADFAVTGLLDWEFAHPGEPVEDLAWCEWIVRTHHPAQAGALHHLFDAYGQPAPPWPRRRSAMLTQCARLEEFCRRRDPDGPGARQWQERGRLTAGWPEPS
ncbi:phosphotransferase family protein [Kitasatospora sp. NPDC001132]